GTDEAAAGGGARPGACGPAKGSAEATTWGTGEAPATTALLPMEEAATDAAARVSRIRLSTDGVIRRDRSTKRRLPVTTPMPYTAVLMSNQPETQVPRSRTSAVKAASGLDCRAQVARWYRFT